MKRRPPVVTACQLHYDVLRPHRVAALAKVHTEKFSTQPLEGGGAAMYEPPDDYVGAE